MSIQVCGKNRSTAGSCCYCSRYHRAVLILRSTSGQGTEVRLCRACASEAASQIRRLL